MSNQPKPGTLLYINMLSDIETGKIKIPQFQRKFVLTLEQTAGLIDSILKGYPIGTFIIWETDERLRSIRNLGGADLPETPAGSRVQYVLDGQQRMTSIYVALKGAKIVNEDGVPVDYGNIYVDLKAAMDEQIVVIAKEDDDNRYISVVDLVHAKTRWLTEHYSSDDLDVIDNYKDAIKTYQFTKIDIIDAPLDVATEIFTRINVTGKPLSLFEIMVAKTYDADKDFDLSEKYDALIQKLIPFGYDGISSSTVLQTIGAILIKDCRKKGILRLDKQSFIDVYAKAEQSIIDAISYFYNTYRIVAAQILPYDALIVPFAYFRYFHPDKPLGQQSDYLRDYFWHCVLAGRFSSAVDSKLTQDIKSIDDILAGKKPVYDYGIDISCDAIRAKGYFTAGSAFIKGLICILADHQPKSFADNTTVTMTNAWLARADRQNYHHFFPKAYMRKYQPLIEDWRVNHIANITIVDDYINKYRIGARAPSDYMAEFRKFNPDGIEKTMDDHLISLTEESGVFSDDYETFFQYRLKRFNEELKKRVILGEMDKA